MIHRPQTNPIAHTKRKTINNQADNRTKTIKSKETHRHTDRKTADKRTKRNKAQETDTPTDQTAHRTNNGHTNKKQQA
mgnify:CR=1 FL=1